MITITFVYKKNETLKFFNLEEAKNLHNTLLRDGWKHIETLDPVIILNRIYEDFKCKDVINKIINEL